MLNIEKIKEYSKSRFVQDLLTLASGTAIAQLIPILASPLLTRIFSPADFGVLANFLSITSIIMVFYSGKFEFAIVLPKRHEEAINIVSLAIILSLASTIVFSLIFIFIGNSLGALLNFNNITRWLWATPISALLFNIFFIFNEWCIRKNNYLILSKNKITNTTGIALNSLILGFSKIDIGLIWGQLIGQLIAVFFAIKRFIKDDYSLIKFISFKKIQYFSKRYLEFFKYYMPGQLINTITGQLPILIFTMQFGIYKVGLYALTDRVFGVTMSFIGNAIRDVFKQKAAKEFQEKGNCFNTFKKVSFFLFAISLILFLFLFIISPMLFSIAFGSEWAEAGFIARILCIMYMLAFISVPVSYAIIIAEKQKYEFIWQLTFLFFTLIPLLIGLKANDFHLSLILLAGGRSISYLFQFWLSYKVAQGIKNC